MSTDNKQNVKVKKVTEWQDELAISVTTVPNKATLELFRASFANSYKCKESEISYTFEKIKESPSDTVYRDDMLKMLYFQTYVAETGKLCKRTIFSTNVEVDNEVRQKIHHKILLTISSPLRINGTKLSWQQYGTRRSRLAEEEKNKQHSLVSGRRRL